MSVENVSPGALSKARAPLAEVKPRKPSWQVRLGFLEWNRYTYERSPADQLQLLGSIRKGMQSGALAKSADGHYVMIVGDHETPLNTASVEKLLPKGLKNSVVAPEFQPAKPSGPAPVVTVKKRRSVKPG
jgi:hypothetical protein